MPDVAFCRTLEVGKRGKDVIAHKRALSRSAPDLYPWRDFTGFYGEHFREAVKKWQKREGMTVTGKIGRKTHEALEKAKNKDGAAAFDPLSVQMAYAFCEEFVDSPRENIVEAAHYWYLQRAKIYYSQARPFALGRPPWYPSRWDCSGFATACYFAANAPDPNGRGYDGNGYTGTQIAHGRKISMAQLRDGDLIFYGFTTSSRPGFPYGSPTHVAVYVGNGMVISNGHYPMGFYTIHYRSDLNHCRTYEV